MNLKHIGHIYLSSEIIKPPEIAIKQKFVVKTEDTLIAADIDDAKGQAFLY